MTPWWTSLAASVIAALSGLTGAWLGVRAGRWREEEANQRAVEDRTARQAFDRGILQERRNYERESEAASRILLAFAANDIGPRVEPENVDEEHVIELLRAIKRERVYFRDKSLRWGLGQACLILEHSLTAPLVPGYTIAMTRWILRRNLATWLSEVIRDEGLSVHAPTASWDLLEDAVKKRQEENQEALFALGISELEFAPRDDYY